jgi:hypothetical protein
VAAQEAATHHDHRGQRPRLQNHRCEAKTDSGSRPEIFSTVIQPKRLTSAPGKKEIAVNGIAPKNRSKSGIGPVNTSPIQESRPPYGMNNGLSTSLLSKERRQLQDRGPNAPDERDANDQPGDEKVDDVTL